MCPLFWGPWFIVLNDLHCLVKCSHIYSRGERQMANICNVRFRKRTLLGSFFYQAVKSWNCLLLESVVCCSSPVYALRRQWKSHLRHYGKLNNKETLYNRMTMTSNSLIYSSSNCRLVSPGCWNVSHQELSFTGLTGSSRWSHWIEKINSCCETYKENVTGTFWKVLTGNSSIWFSHKDLKTKDETAN